MSDLVRWPAASNDDPDERGIFYFFWKQRAAYNAGPAYIDITDNRYFTRGLKPLSLKYYYLGRNRQTEERSAC